VGSAAYKAAVDCPLLQSSGVGYDEAMRVCGDLLTFTTAGDYKSTPGPIHQLPGGTLLTQIMEEVPLGQGECDWPRFLKPLKEVRYDYWINYEMCSRMRGGGTENNLDRIARSRSHIFGALLTGSIIVRPDSECASGE